MSVQSLLKHVFTLIGVMLKGQTSSTNEGDDGDTKGPFYISPQFRAMIVVVLASLCMSSFVFYKYSTDKKDDGSTSLLYKEMYEKAIEKIDAYEERTNEMLVINSDLKDEIYSLKDNNLKLKHELTKAGDANLYLHEQLRESKDDLVDEMGISQGLRSRITELEKLLFAIRSGGRSEVVDHSPIPTGGHLDIPHYDNDGTLHSPDKVREQELQDGKKALKDIN